MIISEWNAFEKNLNRMEDFIWTNINLNARPYMISVRIKFGKVYQNTSVSRNCYDDFLRIFSSKLYKVVRNNCWIPLYYNYVGCALLCIICVLSFIYVDWLSVTFRFPPFYPVIYVTHFGTGYMPQSGITSLTINQLSILYFLPHNNLRRSTLFGF